MAFNLSALKALFSKLKPAAKAVAPMTDDIARLGANYGDDALAIANKADDFFPTDGTWEPVPGLNLEEFVPRKLPKNISNYPDPDFSFPSTTSVLGDVMLDTRRVGPGTDGVWDIETVLNPHYIFNQTLSKPLDTSGMVIQTPELLRGLDYQDVDNFAFGIRPHKNTALGRWFAKNNPNYGFDMEEDFYF